MHKITLYFLLILIGMSIFSCQSSSEKMSLSTNDGLVFYGDYAGNNFEIALKEKPNDSFVEAKILYQNKYINLSGFRSNIDVGYAYDLVETGIQRHKGSYNIEYDTTANILMGSWHLSDSTGAGDAVLFILKPKLDK